MLSIDLFQKRIANISVGSSTVRGQPKRTVKIAREYLKSINLRDFSRINNEEEFNHLLDVHTNKLREELPSKSWGIARKILNLFLFQTSHDIFLNRRYSLDKLIPYLEVPLDNPNAKKLKIFAGLDGVKLEWKNIYSLEPEISAKFQKYAKNYAIKTYQCERCYLDIYWWRSE